MPKGLDFDRYDSVVSLGGATFPVLSKGVNKDIAAICGEIYLNYEMDDNIRRNLRKLRAESSYMNYLDIIHVYLCQLSQREIEFLCEEAMLIREFSDLYRRCYDKTHVNYGNFGGQRWKICHEWTCPGGYLTFKQEMQPKISRERGSLLAKDSILRCWDARDVLDSANAYWFEREEERKWKNIEIGGVTYTLEEASKLIGMSSKTMYRRLQQVKVSSQSYFDLLTMLPYHTDVVVTTSTADFVWKTT